MTESLPTSTDAVRGLSIGSTASLTRTVSAADIEGFAAVTGDDQPLHTDPEFGKRTRFGKPIAHGMLGAGILSAAIGTQLAPDSVVVYLAQNLQFRAPVHAGDTVTATVTVTAIDVARSRVSLDTVVTNQDGTAVIRGDALVMVEALREL